MKKLLCLPALMALSLLLACGGGGGGGRVQKGINAYNMSAYPIAMREFADVDEEKLNEKGRVKLHVYRGLARFNLGDRAGASQDLAMGQQLYAAGDPKWLPPIALQQMNDVMAQLSGPPAPARAPAPTAPATTAPAATAPVSPYLPPQPK